ncbi:O-antigen ligase family protein [Pseudomarimonas salicorniae]|uniref:O-antigen ligase family protein n=1 Tax=Pseudomarimonas salicorniae TaxID=2933270 RepID=A0ABT0GEB0_9GAMM|nr:O-antigen ligase family protein [Lysobacter sp. CAU 1642]MCK7592884.1 O-antigen ligase family protein [Lysobacter sp. CAU 1642]
MAERLAVGLFIACFALLPFGRLVELPMAIAALLGLGLLRHAPRPWERWQLNFASLVFAAYWIPELVSALDAVDLRRSWGEVAVDLRYLPMLWYFADRLCGDGAQRRVQGALAVIVGLWVLDALVQAASGWSLGGAGSQDRLSGIFGADHLKLGAMVAVLGVFLLNLSLRWHPLLAGLAALAVLGVVLLAGTRAAWIMLAVVLLGLGLARFGARRALLGLLVAVLLGGALGALGYRSSDSFAARIDRSVAVLSGDRAGIDHALAFRLPIWETALGMTVAHPFNGVGVRGFRVAYEEYADEDDRWIGFDGEHGAAHAHNIVLELLSETGLVGLLAWGIAAFAAWRGWIWASPERRALALAPGVALLAMLFPLNTHYAVYSSVWGGLLLLLAALYAAALRPKAGDLPSSGAGG